VSLIVVEVIELLVEETLGQRGKTAGVEALETHDARDRLGAQPDIVGKLPVHVAARIAHALAEGVDAHKAAGALDLLRHPPRLCNAGMKLFSHSPEHIVGQVDPPRELPQGETEETAGAGMPFEVSKTQIMESEGRRMG
jgi:hypothetical protein